MHFWINVETEKQLIFLYYSLIENIHELGYTSVKLNYELKYGLHHGFFSKYFILF